MEIFEFADNVDTNEVPNDEPLHLDLLCFPSSQPGRVAQSVGHLTRKSEVLGWIPGLATYFHFSFR